GHVVRLAEMAFDLDEEGDHARLRNGDASSPDGAKRNPGPPVPFVRTAPLSRIPLRSMRATKRSKAIQQKAQGVASYTFVSGSSTLVARNTDPDEVMPVDLRLYAIVDPEHAGGRSLPDLAKLLAQGGATLVQLRDKKNDARVMIDTARALKAALKPFGVPLLVNDRVDVALAAGADG